MHGAWAAAAPRFEGRRRGGRGPPAAAIASGGPRAIAQAAQEQKANRQAMSWQRNWMEASILPLLGGLTVASALPNGQARTPPMGFNPWNVWGVSATGKPKLSGGHGGWNQSMMLGAAAAIDRLGLREKGYIYVNFDCGWTTGFRVEGRLQVNATRFPDIHSYARQLRTLGYKFGSYAGGGPVTDPSHHSQCCSRAIVGANDTSYGHWTEDVAFLVGELGAEYLKSDPCGGPQQAEYTLAHNRGWVQALKAAGLLDKVHFQGDEQCGALGRPPNASCAGATAAAANSWRTTGDIDNSWAKVLRNIEENDAYGPYAGPGHFNDPDLLEIGNPGLSYAESVSQFSLWCVAKAPLMISTDPSQLNESVLGILGNTDAIAVNQDQLGVQGRRVRADNETGAQVWAGPLAPEKDGGSAEFAAVLLNTADAKLTIFIERADLLAVAANWSVPDSLAARDIWQGMAPVGTLTASGGLSLSVEPHGSRFLRLVASPDGGTGGPAAHDAAEAQT
jgi:alpha-galactosidase